jgi:phage-related protein
VAVDLGSAYVQIVPSLKGAQATITKELAGAGADSGSKFSKGFAGAIGPLAGIAVAGLGVAKFTGFIKDSIAAVGNWQALNAQSAAAVKATGGAAGVSAKQVDALAQSLEGQTATQAESIQQGANLLLTFKGVQNEAGKGNDIFNQTTAAAVDMARAMGTDVPSAALQLGKALNDPAQGLTRLTRSGVTFTKEQTAQIKALQASGDKLGAQKIILAELNNEFGGSGAAYAKTYEGSLYRLSDAVGDFGEAIATAAMPALTRLIDTGTKIANWATNSGVIEKTAAGIGAAFAGLSGVIARVVVAFKGGGLEGALSAAFGDNIAGTVADVIATFSTLGTAFTPIIASIGAAFATLGPVILTAVTQLSPFGNLFKALAPVLPQIASVIVTLATALGGALASALTAVIPFVAQLVTTLSGVFVAIMPVVVSLVGTLVTAFGLLVPTVTNLLSAILPLVASLIGSLAPVLTQLVTSVLPLVGQAFTAIVSAVVPLVQTITSILIPVIQALLPVVSAVFSAIVPIIQAALQIVVGIIKVVTGIITGNWKQVWGGLGQIVSGAFNLVVGVIRGAIGIVGAALGAVLNAGVAIIKGGVKIFVDAGRAIIQGFIDGIKGMIGAVGDAVGGVMDFVGGFFPHSPAKRGPFSGSGWRAIAKSGAAIGEQFTGGFDSSVKDFGGSMRSLVPDTISSNISGNISNTSRAASTTVLIGNKTNVRLEDLVDVRIARNAEDETRAQRLGFQPLVFG